MANTSVNLTDLDSVIGCVAERILTWTAASIGMDHGALAAEVRAALTFGDRSAPARLGGNAASGLAAAAMAITDVAGCRAELAKVAVRFHRVRTMHVECGGDPTTGIRAAQLAYDALQGVDLGTGGSVGDADAITVIALWILGRWLCEHRWSRMASVLLDPEKAGQAREAAIAAAGLHQWNAHRFSYRRRDLQVLLDDRPELIELFDTVLMAVVPGESEANAVLAAHQHWIEERQGGCYCRDPAVVFQALFGDQVPALGASLGDCTDEQRSFLDRVRDVSRPRGDVLVESDRAWVPEPEPFTSSFLVAALGEVPRTRVVRWHESSVSSEVRSTFSAFGTCRTNVEWRREGAYERVSGELDCLVTLDSVLFDFQAKAASSPDYTNRHHLIFEDAGEQHQRFRDALSGPGAWPLKRGGAVSTRQPWRLSDQFMLHVPISVGVEYRRSFSVGGSQAHGELPRVVTTLDHLRLVNDFVPGPFRIAYWLDRFAAEHGDLKFVDETSFLGDWLALLHGQNVPLKVAPSGIVMARNDEFGHCLAAVNDAEARGDLLASKRYISTLNSFGPDHVAPRFTRLLASLGQARTSGVIHLLRCVVNTNLTEVDARLRAGRSFRVERNRDGNGARGLSWALDLDDGRGRMLARDVDVVLARRGSRWELRFPGSSVAERTRELGTPAGVRFTRGV